MKKTLIFVILVIAMGNLFSQNSVADTDNFLAAKINSAAMAYGNGSGTGFLLPYQEDVDFGKRLTLFINGDNGGYVMDKTGDYYNHKLY